MIPIHPNEHELLRRLSEHFRLFVVHEDVAHIDAILEHLCNMEGRDDPTWKQPSVMGLGMRKCVAEALGATGETP